MHYQIYYRPSTISHLFARSLRSAFCFALFIVLVGCSTEPSEPYVEYMKANVNGKEWKASSFGEGLLIGIGSGGDTIRLKLYRSTNRNFPAHFILDTAKNHFIYSTLGVSDSAVTGRVTVHKVIPTSQTGSDGKTYQRSRYIGEFHFTTRGGVLITNGSFDCLNRTQYAS